MSLRLPAGKKPGAALRAVLLLLARQARRDLERLADAPEAHIHSLRTGMKKYRSLLRLARGDAKRKLRAALMERVRVLKDGMAGSRDDAVIFKTVRRVLGEEAAERLGLKCPHAEGKTRAPKALLLAAFELGVLTDSLDLDAMNTAKLTRRWEDTIRRRDKARRSAKSSGDAHDFHMWRKRVKDLWYQSDALSSRLKKTAAAVKPAKKLSDELGLEHDLTLVLESVKNLTDADRAALDAKRGQLRDVALGE
ncbi:MAG: CHAD domain-containing protein [Chthoniobacterales bacterium]